MQVYKLTIKSTGVDFFTFYATTGAVKCNHQVVVATTGAFTLTSVNNGSFQNKTYQPSIITYDYFIMFSNCFQYLNAYLEYS